MSATILYGKPIVEKIVNHAKTTVEDLVRRGINPRLAIVMTEASAANSSYYKSIMARCAEMAICVESAVMKKTDYQKISQWALNNSMEALSRRDDVHGILLMKPVIDGLNAEKACEHMDPAKDVDGATVTSMSKIYSGTMPCFLPCTAEAVLTMLWYYGINPADKNITVIGRSSVIGMPVATALTHADATVTLCHSKTKDLREHLANADVVITAAGKAGLLTADSFSLRDSSRPGPVIIDVGVNMNAEGKLCGDADFNGLLNIASAITPVPGGVGPLTAAVLASHVATAALQSALPKEK